MIPSPAPTGALQGSLHHGADGRDSSTAHFRFCVYSPFLIGSWAISTRKPDPFNSVDMPFSQSLEHTSALSCLLPGSERRDMTTGFFFSLPYHGHVYPCLPIVEALTLQGNEIVAYSTDTFRPAFKAAGAKFEEFPYTQSDKRALVTMAYWQLRVVDDAMPRLVKEARKRNARYVLSDSSCHWGYVLARYLALPLILLHSTVPTAFLKISPLESIFLDLRRAPQVLPTVAKFLWLDQYLSQRWLTPPLRSPVSLIQPRCGSLQLVLTHECMRSSSADVSYEFVGPCVRRRASIPGEPLPPENGRPLVYVSLGTIWNERADFYRLCIEAFAATDYQVLIVTGVNVDPLLLPNPPENVHLRSHVDQIAVLERAAAFISHGGMSSLTEAMKAGVPLVLFPQANDQFALSEAMVRRGRAILLSPRDLSAQSLRAAIHKVVHDSKLQLECRRCCDEMLRAGDGGAHAARRILEWIREPPGNIPYAHH
jgi:MGT family glycosyltransferase